MKKRASIIFKIFIIIVGITGIALQCGVGTDKISLLSFCMFTTQSNLAVIVYYICHLLICRKSDCVTVENTSKAPNSDCEDAVNKQHRRAREEGLVQWKFLITMGILLTGLVAHFMLQGQFDDLPAGHRFGLILLHYVVPISVFLDWLLFDEKGRTKKWMPLFATIFPLLYVTTAMIVVAGFGLLTYPYPFLNVDVLGWTAVLLTIAGLSAAFVAVGFLGYALDHLLKKQVPTYKTPENRGV